MTEETLQQGSELSVKLDMTRKALRTLKDGDCLYTSDSCYQSEQLSNDMVTPAIKGLIIENYEKLLTKLEKEFSELK